VRYLCRLNNFFNKGLTITDSHFELLRSLGGNFEEDAGRLNIEKTFINLSGDQLPGDGTALHHAKTIFRGEELTISGGALTYYQTSVGPMSFCAKYGLFDNVQFDALPFNTQGIAQTNFRHCKVGIFPFGDDEKITGVLPNGIGDQKPYFTTGMEYILPLRGYWDAKYGSITRKKINRTINNQGQGLKDAQIIFLGSLAISNILDPDNVNGYSSAQFTLTTSSDEFKALQVGDNVLTQSTDEFGRASIMHQFGTVVSKNGGTGVVIVKNIPYGTTAATITLFIYRPHTLIPVFAIGNITSGVSSITGVIIEGDATQFPANVTINSPFFRMGPLH
jgi:hypothetical protein